MNKQELNDAIEAAKKSEVARKEWIRDNIGNFEAADFSTMPKGMAVIENIQVHADIVGGLQKRNHFRITFKIDGKRATRAKVESLAE